MKAFGVRLAAGAVTILLGAIMAAQAQKDQQNSTDSAWTEDQIPPGKAVSPIGSDVGLLSANPMDVRSLKPVDETTWDEPTKPDAVRLVQHTEPLGAMSLPGESLPGDITDPSAGESPALKAAGRSVMKMRLPSFDEAPPMEPSETGEPPRGSAPESAGPSFSMGLPAAAAAPPAATFSNQPKLSEFTFADTEAAAPPADNLADNLADNGAAMPGPPPTNDLRSVMPPASPAFDAVGFAETGEMDSASQSGAGPSHSLVEFSGGPALADSVDPSAGVPAAMLTPVVHGQEAGVAEFAEAPGTTMRIHRDPPVKMEIGAAHLPYQDEAIESSGLNSQPPHAASTFGIASQPQIVGSGTQMSMGNSAGSQPVAATTGQGFAQPAGGFAVPQNYASSEMPQSQSPPLPLPSIPASEFAPPPLQSQADFGQTARASAPYASAAMDGSTAIYQGVGYKQSGLDRPLPAGPTMASPGERYLDGPQSPSVVIHKRAPAEVKVGKPASFVITVKNVGGSKALDVQVHDRVPTGMILTDATPRPNPKFQPELFWELGDLEPNQERTITLQLTPEQEGELGSVARVTFQAAASVRTISTRPELKVVQKAPEKVLIGQQLEIELEVSNPGTGEATGVVLQEDVPAGLEHPQGTQLDNLIGSLGPGEIRRQILRMRAVKPGIVQNQIRVKGDDGLETTHTVAVEVISPELTAVLNGPSRRFLERQATYQLEIANVGTADATNVELSVQLDRGFTFVKTDFEGQYDSSRHAVFWSLPALPVGQSGKVPLTLLPVEEGKRVLRTEASADLGIKTIAESQVEVASLAELTFSINDSADPIEVGGETVYEIRVSNTGSRDDTNVKVALQLPPGLQLVEQGDFTAQGQGIIAFSPRALLKANDQIVYKVKAQGVTPGRYLVKAIVTSDQSNVPVTKEESIMVYADR